MVPMRMSKTWNPSSGGKIYNAVGYIIDELNELISTAKGEILYLLQMYQDMFFPLIAYMETHNTSDEHLCHDEGRGAPIERLLPVKAFHEGMLPDQVKKLMKCSFWSEMQKMEPIVHLLSKSTPQRCQIRSLTAIMYNYCQMHEDVFEFVIETMKASMIGAYRGTVRPSFRVRLEVFKVFQNITRREFLAFMQEKHQQLLFFTIKEYLIFAAHHIPALHAELVIRYRWKSFEQKVTETMDTVRSMINANDVMEFPGVERYLTSVNRVQPHLYRPKRHQFSRVLMHEFEHHDDTNALATSKHKHWDLMYEMLIRVPLAPMPIDWLSMFGVSESVIKTLKGFQETYNITGSRGSIREFVSSLDRNTFDTVRALARAYDRKFNVRMFTLPVHITIAQIRALRQMHNLRDGEPMHPNIGTTLICMECKSFKGFVAYRTAKNVHNIFAYGQTRVLVDDDTGKMYCGKRCDKVDKNRNTKTYEWNAVMDMANANKRKEAKSKRKREMNDQCASVELTRVSLVGNLLQFYGVLYSICPQCGNFFKYDPKNVYNGFYCGCCMENGHLFRNIRCEWCRCRQHLENVQVSCDRGSIYLCKSCHKPWIRNATLLPVEVIRKGLKEKWKRLQTV